MLEQTAELWIGGHSLVLDLASVDNHAPALVELKEVDLRHLRKSEVVDPSGQRGIATDREDFCVVGSRKDDAGQDRVELERNHDMSG